MASNRGPLMLGFVLRAYPGRSAVSAWRKHLALQTNVDEPVRGEE
jgi:hypothetical protein